VTSQEASVGKTAAAQAEFSPTYKWYALGILFSVYVFNFIDRQILSILQESIKQDLGLFDWQLGMIGGIAFALFYATLGIPIARLADKHSRKTIIAIALATWSLMTVLCGTVTNFIGLMLARIGVAVGEAGASPPSHSLISDYFEPEKRATALSIYALGIPIGVMFGYLAGGFINQFFGWRLAFMAVGLPGLLLAVFVYFFLREPPRGMSEQRTEEGAQDAPDIKQVAQTLWASKSFRHLSIAAGLHAFVGYGFGQWIPSFFFRVHEMSSGELVTYLAPLSGIVGGLSTYLGGYLSDRFGQKDKRWYMWIPAIGIIVPLPFTIAAMLVGSPYAALGLYIIPVLMGSFYLGPTFAMTQGLVDLRMRAVASSILLFILNLIGLGLGPLIVGIMSDLLTPAYGINALRYALVISLVANIWSAIHYMFAAKTLSSDLDRVAAQNGTATYQRLA
jgi:MFS family permease